MKKMEEDAALDFENASHASLELRRKHQLELRGKRQRTHRSKDVQKKKIDKEMDKAVAKYDSALENCKEKFDKEK